MFCAVHDLHSCILCLDFGDEPLSRLNSGRLTSCFPGKVHLTLQDHFPEHFQFTLDTAGMLSLLVNYSLVCRFCCLFRCSPHTIPTARKRILPFKPSWGVMLQRTANVLQKRQCIGWPQLAVARKSDADFSEMPRKKGWKAQAASSRLTTTTCFSKASWQQLRKQIIGTRSSQAPGS